MIDWDKIHYRFGNRIERIQFHRPGLITCKTPEEVPVNGLVSRGAMGMVVEARKGDLVIGHTMSKVGPDGSVVVHLFDIPWQLNE